jgi:hypothetical protein
LVPTVKEAWAKAVGVVSKAKPATSSVKMLATQENAEGLGAGDISACIIFAAMKFVAEQLEKQTILESWLRQYGHLLIGDRQRV